MAIRRKNVGLWRRGRMWYARVQVPSDLQDHFGRIEFVESLKTENHGEAELRWLEVRAKHLNNFEVARKKIRGDYRHVDALTSDEIIQLGREVYNYFEKKELLSESTGGSISDADWDRHVQSHKEMLAEIERSFSRHGVRDIFATNFADQILERNLIRLKTESESYQRLCRTVMDAALEVQRRIVSRLEGREFPSRIDPRFVDGDGQTKPFVSLRQGNVSLRSKDNLRTLIEEYVNIDHRHRTEKTRKSLHSYLSTMAAIVGPDRDVASITRRDCLDARRIITALPRDATKLRNLHELSHEDITHKAKANNLKTLSPQGMNNYLNSFLAFLRWCERSGIIEKIPIHAEYFRVVDPIPKHEKRLPFTADHLKIIFNSDVYTAGHADGSTYWVPLIALWNGMRSNEICQLDVSDVRLIGDVWVFDISASSTSKNSDKFVKTQSSIRAIPIHPFLIKCGFLRFHASKASSGKMFDDITRGSDGYYSTNFSKRINRKFRELGVNDEKHKFHSFRHNFRDETRRVEMEAGIAKALGGWTNRNTDAFEIYGK
ncbi:DUF6538 domain-containing protein [Albimonas donghaensis]